jgi:hypothetical protein
LAGASVSSSTFAQILKDYYLPPIVAMLNSQSMFLKLFEGNPRAAELAEKAEKLTYLLAEGERRSIPEELEEVGNLLNFRDGNVWRLPHDHPLAA